MDLKLIYVRLGKSFSYSLITPKDSRGLRDLVRYCFKLNDMITGEKNRAHNCLMVSKLKLYAISSIILFQTHSSHKE